MAYETNWTPIVELQTGDEVNLKLGNAFSNIDIGLTALTNAEDRITVNETGISSLQTRVTTNESDIQAIKDRVYTFEKGIDIIVADTSWVTLGDISVPTHSAGTFEYKVSTTYTLDSTNTSALFRLSIDGGTTWSVYTLEPSDASDVYPFTYFFPVTATENEGLTLIFEASKEVVGDNMVVLFADTIIEQK